MNVWQYSRWVYLIGRSIKNKSLEPSEREAFIVFIDGILKYRPYLMSQLNIKKGNNEQGWKNQNDYSLGKMLQVIGRNLKQLTLNIEEKIYAYDERIAPGAEVEYQEVESAMKIVNSKGLKLSYKVCADLCFFNRKTIFFFTKGY